MTPAVQLEFDLGIEAQCPHCGHKAPVRAFLRRADVLADVQKRGWYETTAAHT